MWKLEVTYRDGSTKFFKAKNKVEAKVKRHHFLSLFNVEDVDVYEDEDYIDPVEL